MRVFAIKEIHVESGKQRERLENEIKHLRRCDHPNILRLHEVYTIEQEGWANITFLVTKPWVQASLHRLLCEVVSYGTSPSCPWYAPQKLDPWPSVVLQLILGVKHIYEKFVRHKDLKPENILLLDESKGDYTRPRIRPIIADFEISKGSFTGIKSTFHGTDQYLAPEQIDRIASTPESDVFSLGCCFAWIFSVLSSKPLRKGEEGEHGTTQLEEIACRGFANTIDEILDLLGRLQAKEETSDQPGRTFFLTFFREIIIKRMIVAAPDARSTLDELLVFLLTILSHLNFQNNSAATTMEVYSAIEKSKPICHWIKVDRIVR